MFCETIEKLKKYGELGSKFISGTFFAVSNTPKNRPVSHFGMSSIPQTHMTHDAAEKGTEESYRNAYAKFVELASHDLRAPLRKLGVLTDRLISRFPADKEDDIKQYTERIHACLSEMQLLIDGFSELAAVTPASMRIENCDLEEMIDKILKEHANIVGEKQADIQIANLPRIEGDCRQMKMMFGKIIENAFKFSRQDMAVHLRITGEEAETSDVNAIEFLPGKKYFKIKISDNGIGFSPSDNKNVFQPLVRLHGKSTYPGSGMGLAIVKRIVENHEGFVFAEGGDNGTTITILLPENHH